MIKFIHNISGDFDEKQEHKIVFTSSDGMYSLTQNVGDTARMKSMSFSNPSSTECCRYLDFLILLLFENH